MVKPIIILLLLVIVIPQSTFAQDDQLQVVASFSILADVAQHIAGEAASVTSLMPIDTDPHAYEPTPREVASLAEADVVLLNGFGFEATLMESLENAAEDINLVEISQCVPARYFGDDVAASHQEISDMCQAHYAELGLESPANESDCQTNHSDESHEAGCDPHVWLDPQNVMLWTLSIRDTLIALDPDHAETYQTNAANYLAELSLVANEELVPLMASIPAENRKLVTNHDALGYFAQAYGLEIVGLVIPSASTMAEPSAREIAQLIDTIRAQHISAIFAETTVNADLAQQIADETDAKFYELYTGSLSEPDGVAATYLDYMRYNAHTIASALGGE